MFSELNPSYPVEFVWRAGAINPVLEQFVQGVLEPFIKNSNDLMTRSTVTVYRQKRRRSAPVGNQACATTHPGAQIGRHRFAVRGRGKIETVEMPRFEAK